MNKKLPLLAMFVMSLTAMAQSEPDSVAMESQVSDVMVTAVHSRHGSGLEMRDMMGRGELAKAACCNLGESFQNSASVDVEYSDAATGV